MRTFSHGRIWPECGALRNEKSQSLCTLAPSPRMMGGASARSILFAVIASRICPPLSSRMWQPWQL
jgi:hypothetical protein